MGIMQFSLVWIVVPSAKVWKLCYTPSASVVGSLLNAIFGKCLKNIASQGATINVGDSDKKKDDPILVSNQHQNYGTDGPGQQSSVYPNLHLIRTLTERRDCSSIRYELDRNI